jgi:hypothetical protein
MHLKSKVVVVTGAASGIGREIARTFWVDGEKAAIADLNQAGAAAAAAELGDVDSAIGIGMVGAAEMDIPRLGKPCLLPGRLASSRERSRVGRDDQRLRNRGVGKSSAVPRKRNPLQVRTHHAASSIGAGPAMADNLSIDRRTSALLVMDFQTLIVDTMPPARRRCWIGRQS